MPAFKVRHEPQGLVLALDDPASLNDFRPNPLHDELFQFVQELTKPRMALDLGAIDYLSSSGVAILIGLKRRIDAQQGKLVLFRIQPVVLDLMRKMSLTRHFAIAADEPQALEALCPLPLA